MPKTKTKSKSLANRSSLKFDKTLILVIAAVVVATGGYLFYKGTHAAAAHVLTNRADQIQLLNGRAVKQTDSHGGKPNTTIWRVEKNSTVETSFKIFALTKSIPNVMFCVNHRFKVPSSDRSFAIGLPNGAGTLGRNDNSYKYYKACSSGVALKGLTVGAYNQVRISVSTWNPSSDLYVVYISMEWN